MNTPICSVIIPSYNCVEYLPIALNSVAAQFIEPIEILVLDDGSTDGTWDYLREAKVHYRGLSIVKGGRLGPSDGRNILISMAKSPLIAFLDADDFWWPNKLKAQIAFHVANPDVVLSFTDYIHLDPSGLTHGTAFDYWKPGFLREKSGKYQRIENPLAKLLACNPVGTSSVVARKQALQNANGFAKSMPSAEDWDLWLRLAEHGAVAASRSVTMSYLQRAGSLTANREARLDAFDRIITRYRYHQGEGVVEALKAARGRLQVARAEHHRVGDRWLHAAKDHLGACLNSPSKRVARAALADIYCFFKQYMRGEAS